MIPITQGKVSDVGGAVCMFSHASTAGSPVHSQTFVLMNEVAVLVRTNVLLQWTEDVTITFCSLHPSDRSIRTGLHCMLQWTTSVQRVLMVSCPDRYIRRSLYDI